MSKENWDCNFACLWQVKFEVNNKKEKNEIIEEVTKITSSRVTFLIDGLHSIRKHIQDVHPDDEI